VPAKPGKPAAEKPLATVDLAGETEGTARSATFFADPVAAAQGLVAVQVTGRPERLLVDRTVLDEIRREAAALRDEAEGRPKDGKARTKTAEPAPAAGGLVKPAPGVR
jgi:hypothetical protein